MVDSDYVAVWGNVEWKVNRRMECRRKWKSKKKKRLTARNWDVFRSQMEETEYKNISSMNVAMAQVGE